MPFMSDFQTFGLIMLIIFLFGIYPFIMSVLTSPQKEKPMPKKATNETVVGEEPSQAEKFIEKIEALPIVDKYNKFHTDVKRSGKVHAVELTIKGNNRTTIYEFPDFSHLVIDEVYKGQVMEEVTFKAI